MRVRTIGIHIVDGVERVLIGPGNPAGREWLLRLGRAVAGRSKAAAGADWRTRLRAAGQGFLPSSYLLYDIARNGRSDYVSDTQRWRRTARQLYSLALNGDATHLLRDKVGFHAMCRQLGVPTPRVICVSKDGKLHSLGTGEPTWDGIRSLVDAQGCLVIKPVTGAGGRSVMILASLGDGYELNGEVRDWSGVEAELRRLDYFLVGEYVQQAAYASAIFSGSVNVVRFLTVRRRDRDAAILAAAVHRFGCEGSRPVDNFSQGGLSVAIDAATGELGRGVSFPHTGEVAWHSHHPDTGAPIEGVRIPEWERVRDGVLGVADTLSFLPYVGWDVVLTDDHGGFTVLEGNSSPDLDLMQVHRPLLQDPEVRAFYQEEGVIGPGDGAALARA